MAVSSIVHIAPFSIVDLAVVVQTVLFPAVQCCVIPLSPSSHPLITIRTFFPRLDQTTRLSYRNAHLFLPPRLQTVNSQLSCTGLLPDFTTATYQRGIMASVESIKHAAAGAISAAKAASHASGKSRNLKKLHIKAIPYFIVKEVKDLSIGTPPPPCDPMALSSSAYYKKKAYSIHDIISPVDTEFTGLTPRTPYFIRTWRHEVAEFVANYRNNVANCKFEHPGSNRQNSNPFSNNNSSGGFSKANQWSLNPETLVKDLTEERPQWILSAYGPGRDAPEQLWGGAVEQSFEEMRLHFETGAAAGNPQGAVSSECFAFEFTRTIY